MTVTVNTTTTITFEDEGLKVELPAVPIEDSIIHNGVDAIGFLTLDDYPMEYDFPMGVEFIQGNSRRIHYFSGDIREWIEEREEKSMHVFPVGVYEHGGIEYSLAETSVHSSDPWDYVVGGLIAIPDDFTNPKEAAESILREYTSWCNGDVYVTWVGCLEAGEWDWDTCGEWYGYDNAEEGLKVNMDYHSKENK